MVLGLMVYLLLFSSIFCSYLKELSVGTNFLLRDAEINLRTGQVPRLARTILQVECGGKGLSNWLCWSLVDISRVFQLDFLLSRMCIVCAILRLGKA